MSPFERCVVLVADDDPSVLQIVAYSLRSHGYEVILAQNGPMALRECQQRAGPIHLALLDIVMPGMSGPELFEHVRESRPKIEVLFMSGYDANLVPPVLGPGHFIAKPFYPRDVVERVNSVLGNEEICDQLVDEPDAAQP